MPHGHSAAGMALPSKFEKTSHTHTHSVSDLLHWLGGPLCDCLYLYLSPTMDYRNGPTFNASVSRVDLVGKVTVLFLPCELLR